MNTGAFCKTEAVQTFKSLLKQRRRWFLGFITNEVCMLTDIRLWKRYPLLLLIRLAQNTIRTTALLFFIMIISLLTTSQKVKNLPVGFIAVSLGLNWALMIYFSAKLGRWKISLYPLMFVVNPAFNWLYMIVRPDTQNTRSQPKLTSNFTKQYGIFTAGQRTWGGPRADANKADSKTTAEQAIADAEATGDDLNVNPQTFRPAAEARTNSYLHAPLQPPDRLEGRFAPAEILPGGWYYQTNDSGVLRADLARRRSGEPARLSADSRRCSFGSAGWASRSSSREAPVPRRVESLFGEEAVLAYHHRQAAQRPAGGAWYEAPRRQFGVSPGMLPNERRNDQLAQESAPSTPDSSTSTIPPHFPLPSNRQPSLPRAYTPTHTPERSHPTLPRPVYQPGSSAVRNGRSPLARKSFTRLAAMSPTGKGEVEVRVPRRRDETEEERGRRARRRSVSVDGRGRRRLSKAGKESRERGG